MDSIAVSYALLDGPMTVLRPLVAVITAIAAGLGVRLVERREGRSQPFRPTQPEPLQPLQPLRMQPESGPSFWTKLRTGGTFLWSELLPSIGGPFLVGVLLAGLVTALIPDGFLERHLGSGLLPMLAALAVSTPLYVCATSGTPLAAALALKGLSPGAALVFLLAGPATNLASLSVVNSILGRAATVVYLLALALCSLAAGLAVDMLYNAMGWTAANWSAAGAEESHGWFHLATALALLAAILWTWWARRRSGSGSGSGC